MRALLSLLCLLLLTIFLAACGGGAAATPTAPGGGAGAIPLTSTPGAVFPTETAIPEATNVPPAATATTAETATVAPAATATTAETATVALVATATTAGTAPVTGDPAAGKQLYISQGCGGCHTIEGVEGAAGQVCPNHTHVATNAAQEIQSPEYNGQATTVAEYLRESIVNPNAYIVKGYQPDVMPQTYGQTLTDQQINDLVAFLLQQK